MTKFIVKCTFNGTSIALPISARTPEDAAARAAKKRLAKHASVFVVVERATKSVRHIQLGGMQ